MTYYEMRATATAVNAKLAEFAKSDPIDRYGKPGEMIALMAEMAKAFSALVDEVESIKPQGEVDISKPEKE